MDRWGVFAILVVILCGLLLVWSARPGVGSMEDCVAAGRVWDYDEGRCDVVGD